MIWIKKAASSSISVTGEGFPVSCEVKLDVLRHLDLTRSYISCLGNGDEARMELDSVLDSAKDHMCLARTHCATGVLCVA